MYCHVMWDDDTGHIFKVGMRERLGVQRWLIMRKHGANWSEWMSEHNRSFRHFGDADTYLVRLCLHFMHTEYLGMKVDYKLYSQYRGRSLMKQTNPSHYSENMMCGHYPDNNEINLWIKDRYC